MRLKSPNGQVNTSRASNQDQPTSISHFSSSCAMRQNLSGSLTSGDREVVNFTCSRVKTKSKHTNLMKISRIEGYNGK